LGWFREFFTRAKKNLQVGKGTVGGSPKEWFYLRKRGFRSKIGAKERGPANQQTFGRGKREGIVVKKGGFGGKKGTRKQRGRWWVLRPGEKVTAKSSRERNVTQCEKKFWEGIIERKRNEEM